MLQTAKVSQKGMSSSMSSKPLAAFAGAALATGAGRAGLSVDRPIFTAIGLQLYAESIIAYGLIALFCQKSTFDINRIQAQIKWGFHEKAIAYFVHHTIW